MGVGGQLLPLYVGGGGGQLHLLRVQLLQVEEEGVGQLSLLCLLVQQPERGEGLDSHHTVPESGVDHIAAS